MLKVFINRLIFATSVIAISFIFSLAVHYYRQILFQQITIANALSFHSEFAKWLEDSQLLNYPILTPIPTPASTGDKNATTTAPSRSRAATSPIGEVALWQALIQYRSAHQRNDLVLEEPLCRYARSRVEELKNRLTQISPDDSALDGHSGFHRDAQSGMLFKDTGFPAVSENLAYLPNAANATQVIEWGWDTSTSHRDAQLSNEWSHGCVVGPGPFFVALFAHR